MSYQPQGGPWPQQPFPQPQPGYQPPQGPPGWQQPGYGQPWAPQQPAARQPATRPRTVPRKLPPYPAHLVRFPSGLFPRSRRRRGHSIGHYVYLGTHPVALLISLYVNLMIICVVASWLALVAMGWMMWAMLVTMAWLAQVAAAAFRR